MIIYNSEVDFFNLKSTSRRVAIVNTVNCVGVMGKGLALKFKQHYPANYKAYRKACQTNQLRIGNVFSFDENGLTIINFPTKSHWRTPSEYDFIESGLISLGKELLSLGIEAIAIPKLGCGLGGLSWAKVSKMIESVFTDPKFSHIRIVIVGQKTLT